MYHPAATSPETACMNHPARAGRRTVLLVETWGLCDACLARRYGTTIAQVRRSRVVSYGDEPEPDGREEGRHAD